MILITSYNINIIIIIVVDKVERNFKRKLCKNRIDSKDLTRKEGKLSIINHWDTMALCNALLGLFFAVATRIKRASHSLTSHITQDY